MSDERTTSQSCDPVAEAHALYFDDLVAYCRRRVGPEGEDLAAEAFARAVSAGAFPTVEDCRRWVTVTARNLCIDLGRSARVRRRGDFDSVHVWLVSHDPADDPAVVAETRSSLAHVRDALATLTSRDRELIVLRDWLGLGVDEVADRTGLTSESVRTMASRARQRLAASLAAAPAWVAGWFGGLRDFWRRLHATGNRDVVGGALVAQLAVVVPALTIAATFSGPEQVGSEPSGAATAAAGLWATSTVAEVADTLAEVELVPAAAAQPRSGDPPVGESGDVSLKLPPVAVAAPTGTVTGGQDKPDAADAAIAMKLVIVGPDDLTVIAGPEVYWSTLDDIGPGCHEVTVDLTSGSASSGSCDRGR